jgi:ABC-type transport system substrate-binding protein
MHLRYISSHRGRQSGLRMVTHVTLACMLIMGLGFMPLGSAAVHAEEQPQKSGYIVWAVHQSMPMFDIHFDTTYIPAQPVAPVYNGLVTQNPYNAGKIIGDLVERWEITEDGKRITFSLHKGVKFHDGAAFTCAAAQYSVDKLADVTVVEEVYESSSCADDFTLVVSLKRPSTALMTLLSGAHAAMMKKGIAEAVERKDTKFLVGTGPFRFKAYTPGVDFQADTSPSSVHIDEPDLYYARFTWDAPSNYGKYCNPEFDKLFDEQSRMFDVEKRAEITRKMERILLDDLPDDRGYDWKTSMGYWNRVQNWPPLLGTTVYNYGKFE